MDHADQQSTCAGGCRTAPRPRRARRHLALGAALALALAGPAGAQGPKAAVPPSAQKAPEPVPGSSTLGPISPETRRAEQDAAHGAALAAAIPGPASVPLLDQATLALPPGMVFVPAAQAARLLSSHGNHPGASLVGLVTVPGPDEPWIVTINRVAEGHVSDSDAAELKADDILKDLRDSSIEGNKDRARRGFPELELLGWTEPPKYDAATHRLTWSLKLKEAGEDEEDATINFNTRALGRDGYFSLNLITSVDRIAEDSQVSAQLLPGLRYNDGKRYDDFNAGTDHLAGYGLAALIGVVAAKKLGLLALILAFGAKFAKVGLLAVLGLGAAARRLFRRTPRA